MTICAVCHRGLSNQVSVSRGTGPVCDRNVRSYLQVLMTSEMAEQARTSWARLRGEPVGMRNRAVEAARTRFLARVHRQEIVPVQTGTVDMEDANSRRNAGQTEIWFEQFEDGMLIAHSGTNEDYVVVADHTGEQAVSCSCSAYAFHRNQPAGTPCRHMRAYNVLGRHAETETAPSADSVVGHRVEGAPMLMQRIVNEEMAVEQERDTALQQWHERHQHDGILMSENDAAWQDLKARAMSGAGSFETEQVLDGSDTTFGFELEVEFADRGAFQRTLQRLKEEGITDVPMLRQYHSRGTEGYWNPTRDGSLEEPAVELVSPVLRDTPENWRKIGTMMQILHESGALRQTNHTGLHIHIGNDKLDDRGYRWQRLARTVAGFQSCYYQMGAARHSEGRPANHRGINYTRPLHLPHLQRLRRTDTAVEASKKIIGEYRNRIGDRYYMISTHKQAHAGVPTVEFRYPNSTHDPVILQRQIQLAHATILQSAYLRKHMPGAERLPKLFAHDTGPEMNTLSEDREKRFRQYLDTLGSDRLRLLATQLWVRGRA
ncbi:amidoligase family protein [Alicyclobacillus tolerans]|uniref:amidoligase family protein n=1 Tax=Alicyclobacillus tolerans TaxID=90970 RepID=UPI003B8014F8